MYFNNYIKEINSFGKIKNLNDRLDKIYKFTNELKKKRRFSTSKYGEFSIDNF